IWWLVGEGLIRDYPTIGAPLATVWLAAFGALTLAAAIGYELRDRRAPLRGSSIYLVAVNALLLGFIGGAALGDLAGDAWRDGGLVGRAVAHIALGLGLRGGSRAVRGLLVAIGVAIGDVAAGLILGGPALTISWVSGAIVLRLATRRLHGHELTAAQVGL